MDEINKRMLTPDVLSSIDEIDIPDVEKRMKCFCEALRLIHKGVPFDSIVRYRLAHHLLLLKVDSTLTEKWLKVIKKHEIVDYSIAKGKLSLSASKGTLYVPKDRRNSQSTLKYILDKYIPNPIFRDPVDVFDQSIEEKDGLFYINGELIDHIVFIFDLIQGGTATKDTLEYYINSEDEDEKHISFYSKDRRVSVSEIIKRNSCTLEILPIYCGEKGEIKLNEYVTSNTP